MTILHLIRPESGPWPEEIAALQAGQGDRVVALRWCDRADPKAACEVITGYGHHGLTPSPAVSYADLLDLLFDSDRVCCW